MDSYNSKHTLISVVHSQTQNARIFHGLIKPINQTQLFGGRGRERAGSLRVRLGWDVRRPRNVDVEDLEFGSFLGMWGGYGKLQL